MVFGFEVEPIHIVSKRPPPALLRSPMDQPIYFRSIAIAIALLLSLAGVLPAAGADTAVRILVYHRFDPAKAAAMTVTTPVFAAQLAWLASQNITVLPLHALVDRLRAGASLPASSVVLTADDGHRSVYTQMFPLIRRYRVPMTLFIYPSAISNAAYALTWEEIEKMIRSGFVHVQSHTYWHPNFNMEQARLSPSVYRDFVKRQLSLSKSRLEQRLRIQVDLLAWPFGIHDAELDHLAVEAGYVAGFTIDRALVRRGADIMALPRYIVTDEDRGTRFATLVRGDGRKSAR